MIAVICVATLVAGYFLYGQVGGGSSSSASLTSTAADQSGSGQAGSSLVVALQRLKSVTLDASIFSNNTFQSLTDFGVVIPPQQLGRPNPFSPIATTSNLTNAVTLPSVIKTFSGAGQ